MDQEQKQSASTAGEDAQEKAEEKIAFICVGDTDMSVWDMLVQKLTEFGTEPAATHVMQQYLSLGYTVHLDWHCTREDALKMLRDPKVQAFVFMGHAGAESLSMSDNSALHYSEVKQALGGRKLERVELKGCNTDSPQWREAFNAEYFGGASGTYINLVFFGIELGFDPSGKKKDKKEEKKEKKRGRSSQ